jgi:hypothetical protein
MWYLHCKKKDGSCNEQRETSQINRPTNQKITERTSEENGKCISMESKGGINETSDHFTVCISADRLCFEKSMEASKWAG